MSMDEVNAATVGGLLDGLTKWGAALAQVVPRDTDDVPIGAVIVVRGQPETNEILAAVAAVEREWEQADAPPPAAESGRWERGFAQQVKEGWERGAAEHEQGHR